MQRQQTALKTPKSDQLEVLYTSQQACNDSDLGTPGAESEPEAAEQPADSSLALYFKEMAPLPIFQAEQELEAARTMKYLERALWAQTLSNPRLLEWILESIEHSDAFMKLDFSRLRRAARLSGRSAPALLRYEKQCALAAKRMHARDVDRRSLLTVCAELQRLFEREERGRAPRRKGSLRLDSSTFRDYYRQVLALRTAGQRARDEFVRSNLRLVVSIARRFNHGRVPLSDLIQEGNLGLIKAVERFDYRRGNRFSTYATWWIRHSISRALAVTGREVRLPVHLLGIHYKVARAKQKLSTTLGRMPTLEEIGFSANLSLERVEKIQGRLLDQSLSLDRAFSDEDDRSLNELLADPNVVSPTEKIMNESVGEQVQLLLGDLTPIEADVLRKRYGLAGGAVLTLKEIGGSYQLSRERIRQIQEKALDKIQRALQKMKMLS
jgi:RNA polymerase primary sigma factor